MATEPEHCRFLIIGSGPTGLGAAYRLKELGHSDFLIVEAAAHVGGLASSFRDDKGFTWDIGGHVQFSHYRYFDDMMVKSLGKDNWISHERESWVWMRNRFIPYPLQNNLHYLPKDEQWAAIQGLITQYRKPKSEQPANFREWIHATFGAGLAEVFLEPYNFKVWAHPLEHMNYQWIGERVAIIDLERVIKNVIFELDDISWGPNNTFQFPKRGGTGAVWQGVADLVGRDKIRLNTPVRYVDPTNKVAILNKDSRIKYDYLFSTMPIDRLVAMSNGLSSAVGEKAKLLRYSSANIVGIGLGGKPPPTLQKKCWMYFPEDDCPFYRVTVFSNYSPYNVPDVLSQWSLMAEVSESEHKPVDHASLVDDVIRGMRNTRLIGEEQPIISRWRYCALHGYPTPFVGRDQILRSIHAELEPLGVFSRGRFGGWKYEVANQDHSVMQGVEWVNRILLGATETTYRTD
jgi:protoporphyrinogen oxidase